MVTLSGGWIGPSLNGYPYWRLDRALCLQNPLALNLICSTVEKTIAICWKSHLAQPLQYYDYYQFG